MEVRINKYLSSAGYCSRREADRLLEQGRVTIDGIPAQMGSKVTDGQTVFVDGKSIIEEDEKILLAFYKPTESCVRQRQIRVIIILLIILGILKESTRVGRLDKDSEGLILMTNNGEMMDKILRSANGHEKEYIVTVNKEIDDSFIKAMSGGIYLAELDRTTKPCKVTALGKKTFRIILTQGLNRQIRRMCSTQGREVVQLKRIRIMNILLGDLKPGEYRNVTEAEYQQLKEQLYDSAK